MGEAKLCIFSNYKNKKKCRILIGLSQSQVRIKAQQGKKVYEEENSSLLALWFSQDYELNVLIWLPVTDQCSRGVSGLTHLPHHDVPGGLLQQRAVGIDGGEECLAGALANSRPWVHTQLAQLGVEAEPQAVEGGRRVEGPVEWLALLLGLLLQKGLLPLQLVGDGLAPLEEVVRDVPLQGNRERGRTSGKEGQ